ncbi:MAG: potassium-transporting ATPase subunit KdpA, partial [Hungatella hathewayi]|nr:potassium-transporting ATPase subunit KdpA [Hungatella hathewayi]
MTNTAIQMILYCAVLIVLAIPLGRYIGKVMNGEKTVLTRLLSPVENGIYKVLKINREEEMDWKKYAVCAGVFSVISLAVLWLILMLQNILPLNPEGQAGTSWHLGFNTAASFVTNTNWQAYSGESALSYFSQMIGLGVQNFVTPAVGMAVLFALIRGFIRVKKKGIGNFYTDVTKSTVYVLIPLSLIVSVFIVSRGVPQTFRGHEEVQLLEPVTVENEDGTATVVDKQIVPLGPAASQISIKQLGTNGGGFYGVNSAHPLENPDPWSNLFEMISLLLIPAALCFTFGRNIKDKKQGVAVFLAMFIMLALALAVVGYTEQVSTPQIAQGGAVDISTVGQAGGNMEGKETRFGIATSGTWAAFTTAASNGSVNSMHDSYTPLGGMIPMLLMMLGEVVFGGVGCGLYGMLAFAILTVFIAG